MRCLALIPLLALPACIEEHPDWVEPTNAADEAGSSDEGTSETAADGDASSEASTGDSSTGTTTTSTTEGGDGDGDDTTGDGDGDGDESTTGSSSPHQIFITSMLWLGDFGSADQADTLCQEAAGVAGLGGSWKAVISDASGSAAERLSISAPVENLLGDTIASDAAELWSGALQNPIVYTEYNSPSGARAWTGTHSDGSHLVGFDCDGWTAPDNNSKGFGGWPDETSNYWVHGNWEFCALTSRALYCISQ